MPNPLAEEARALSDAELGEAINEAYREMFNLQFQRGTRQLQNPMALRAARRQIARLRTILTERQRAAAEGAPIASPARPTVAVAPPPAADDLESAADEEAAEAAEVEAEAEAIADANDTDAVDATTGEEPEEGASAEDEPAEPVAAAVGDAPAEAGTSKDG